MTETSISFGSKFYKRRLIRGVEESPGDLIVE